MHNRYKILFEEVAIGPKKARNRFFQVPHCNGMGYRDPTAQAAMRGIKAEGGWAVVCTEIVEIHPSSDTTPAVELRLWDDNDIPALARIADSIHVHNSLAGIELCHTGMNSANHYSREIPLGPGNFPVTTDDHAPVQARCMDRQDIRNLRRWHRDAAIRAEKAGYDLIYVYAAHSLDVFHNFLSRRFNHRTDEYGGSLENRVRLLKEILQDTQDAVGGRCAVPCRISIDELLKHDDMEQAEVEDMIGLMAEIPDLWDVAMGIWENDSASSRFTEEGYQEPFITKIKKLTSKPVVGVGRYTTPDRMVSAIQKGVMDFIGAARPSIADPFLPNKIKEGRFEDIRECIGCNICVSGDFTSSPIRCTQNPTMGEEWRRGWHPEIIRKKETDKAVLVIGGGPAGLECAHALGKRGYTIWLAEANDDLGGRVLRESKLPSCAAWRRVRDYRKMQFNKLPNVQAHTNSILNANDILEFSIPRVVLATGARWRRDGVGRQHTVGIPIANTPVFTPDDIMDGKFPEGKKVLVWDDDHYYMGGLMAEVMADAKKNVTYATPATEVSTWTRNTMEQFFIQKKLLEKGTIILPSLTLEKIGNRGAEFSCCYTGKMEEREFDAIILVTSRLPENTLFQALQEKDCATAGIERITAIGDCLAPATIAHAIYAGHRYAQELDATTNDKVMSFKREITLLADN